MNVKIKINKNISVNSLSLCLTVIGGYGIDFSQATDDITGGVAQVAKKILEHGVTSFCPTLVTSPPEIYHKVSLSARTSPTHLHLIHLEFRVCYVLCVCVCEGDSSAEGEGWRSRWSRSAG